MLFECLFSFVECCISVLAASLFFFFQAEDGIRDLVRSRGLGDVYKRQIVVRPRMSVSSAACTARSLSVSSAEVASSSSRIGCLLYTSDAADERSSVDLGGRRIIKKKKVDRQCTMTD